MDLIHLYVAGYRHSSVSSPPIMSRDYCVFVVVIVLSRFSHVRLFVTLWTIPHQVPLSMGFSRQEYGSGLPCPSPGDLPNPGIKLIPFMPPALAGWLVLYHQHHLGSPQSVSCSVVPTPWTVACQSPLSMGFSRQKYWSGLLCPPPRDLPDTGIKPLSTVSPALQTNSLLIESSGKPNQASTAKQRLFE